MKMLLILLLLTLNVVYSSILDARQLDRISLGSKTYFISNILVDNFQAAQQFCNSFGAYVAEVDTEREFQLLQAFQRYYPAIQSLYISGTDCASENRWVHQRTGAQVGFLRWTTGQPSNTWGIENCLELTLAYATGMNDMKCVYPERPIKILCEKDASI
ncbi:ladderlectin [Biomphalaria pfeifferi]|uniref:Ladderlectin n=1 Tax=Biomphalaria pfeifferi TaxID=112525 RepID=A0AAD8B7S2_BIOPF|nr:ladderlectin [Biomphalaria pfeifferi]